jgi:glycosyltransferase involved in cell wall biosynthesis
MELDGLEERRMYVLRQESKTGRAWDYRWENRIWYRLYHLPRFRISIRSADWAVCSTREIWSYLQLFYNLDYRRVFYIPHGVGPRFFFDRPYLPLDAPRLLYVGTWLEQRGVRYLSDALTRLTQELPGTRLTIAGSIEGQERILNYFHPRVRKFVEVVPFVPSECMPEVYAQHDIFVFPSFFEALPLVLLEAMASGMPVVTAETCGMMDVVQNNYNGLLVPPGDSSAIVKCVCEFSQSVELRKQLGRRARETAKNYTWEKVTRELEKVFERAIQTQYNGVARSVGASSSTP